MTDTTNTTDNKSESTRYISPVFPIRPTWNQWFMQHAELAAQRSTCLKLQTGAILVKDDRYIISTGYNGVVGGCSEHCCDFWKKEYSKTYHKLYDTYELFLNSAFFREQHHNWATTNELHGEQNCILMAARYGIATKDTTLYSVYSPCINCAKVIHMAGIKQVYYKKIYKNNSSFEFLRKHGIVITQL